MRRCKEYIRAGDAFQIVLSQRAERPTSASALALYRSLRRVNPSPYLFLLELDGLRARRLLAGDAREVRGRAGEPSTRSPARPRPGEGDAERLLASEKDRAEHVMLVDLGRNDLSRVCRPGTVQVERFLEPERFSHITHLVSEVAGELARRRRRRSICCARRFPAGTVSGAPKVRAMQIISELEGYRRGPYAGAVATTLPGGRARRVHRDPHGRPARRRRATCRPAAGIVADSDPAAEHEECLRKLAALEARDRPRPRQERA